MTAQQYYDKYHEKLTSQNTYIVIEAMKNLYNELVQEAGDIARRNCSKNEARGIPVKKACESYLRDAAVKFENINNMFSPPIFCKGTFNELVKQAREQNNG